jgi:hypothetical protein
MLAKQFATPPLNFILLSQCSHCTALPASDHQNLVPAVALPHIIQAEFDAEQHPEGFILSGKAPEAQQEQPAAAAAAAAAQPADHAAAAAAAGKKRGREEPSEQQPQDEAGQAADGQPAQDQQQAKRQKQVQQQGDLAAAAGGTQDNAIEVIDSEDEDVILVD